MMRLSMFLKGNKRATKIVTDAIGNVVGKKNKSMKPKDEKIVVTDKKNPTQKTAQKSQEHQNKSKATNVRKPKTNVNHKKNANQIHNSAWQNNFLNKNSKPFDIQKHFSYWQSKFPPKEIKIRQIDAETIDDALHRFGNNDYFGNKSLRDDVAKLNKLIKKASKKQITNIDEQLNLEKELQQIVQKLKKHIDPAKLKEIEKNQSTNNDDFAIALATKAGGLFTVISTLLTAIVILNERIEKREDLKEKEKVYSRMIDNLEEQKQELELKQEMLENRLKSEGFIYGFFSTTSKDLSDVGDKISEINKDLKREKVFLKLAQEKLGDLENKVEDNAKLGEVESKVKDKAEDNVNKNEEEIDQLINRTFRVSP